MLGTSKLTLRVAEATKGNKESIINALNEIASIDTSFINKDSLWEEAKGYKSNMDYVSKTVDGYTPQALVYRYLGMWLGRNNYYSCSFVLDN